MFEFFIRKDERDVYTITVRCCQTAARFILFISFYFLSLLWFRRKHRTCIKSIFMYSFIYKLPFINFSWFLNLVFDTTTVCSVVNKMPRYLKSSSFWLRTRISDLEVMSLIYHFKQGLMITARWSQRTTSPAKAERSSWDHQTRATPLHSARKGSLDGVQLEINPTVDVTRTSFLQWLISQQ